MWYRFTMLKKEVVFVGLSGGVDSSVAALRLLNAGYTVVGVFIRVWHPDFIECNEETERLDAMRVAAHLGIPFMTCDAIDAYKHDVADYMISEYAKGRVPNPDVMCNKAVKFGAFLDFAMQNGADKIATGHYARVEKQGRTHALLRGKDATKDQSYFLWTLSEEQLSRVLLPIGDTLKSDIRTEAENAGLPTAIKKDSQGICFLGAIDMQEFLSHFIDEKEGDVIDDNGMIIGTHVGALFYTIGQRHGFTLRTALTTTSSHFVIEKNIEDNTITVSAQKPVAEGQNFLLSNPHWRVPIAELTDKKLVVETRYHQQPISASIKEVNGRVTLRLVECADVPSSGQSAVLYIGDVCLGGGIIEPILVQ